MSIRRFHNMAQMNLLLYAAKIAVSLLIGAGAGCEQSVVLQKL